MIGVDLVTAIVSAAARWGPWMLLAAGLVWKVLPRLIDRTPDILRAWTAHRVAMTDAHFGCQPSLHCRAQINIGQDPNSRIEGHVHDQDLKPAVPGLVGATGE